MLLVVALKTQDAGGISQEAIAVLLILFIGMFSFIVLSAPESNEMRATSTSSKTESTTSSSSQLSETALPDPLDEGFDSPLM
jgi:type IV secretory pathway TrbL component